MGGIWRSFESMKEKHELIIREKKINAGILIRQLFQKKQNASALIDPAYFPVVLCYYLLIFNFWIIYILGNYSWQPVRRAKVNGGWKDWYQN